jgi:hypothetical protein
MDGGTGDKVSLSQLAETLPTDAVAAGDSLRCSFRLGLREREDEGEEALSGKHTGRPASQGRS